MKKKTAAMPHGEGDGLPTGGRSSPVDAAPAEPTPVDATPVEPVPADARPVDARPIDAAPVAATRPPVRSLAAAEIMWRLRLLRAICQDPERRSPEWYTRMADEVAVAAHVLFAIGLLSYPSMLRCRDVAQQLVSWRSEQPWA